MGLQHRIHRDAVHSSDQPLPAEFFIHIHKEAFVNAAFVRSHRNQLTVITGNSQCLGKTHADIFSAASESPGNGNHIILFSLLHNVLLQKRFRVPQQAEPGKQVE